MKKILISPSILSCDFGHLEREVAKSQAAGVDGFHLDIMDGHFVPNISFGVPLVSTMRKLTNLPLDAHLMIDNPGIYLEEFALAGADIITLHLEAYAENFFDASQVKVRARSAAKINATKLWEDINQIKKMRKKVGLAINPATPDKLLDEFLPAVDLVLVMSVNPGFSGQKFMPEVLPKVTNIRQKFCGDLQVDGGINLNTVAPVVAAGANSLVTASYFYSSQNYEMAAQKLRAAAD